MFENVKYDVKRCKNQITRNIKLLTYVEIENREFGGRL
jgi:hypothetical protein